MSRHTQPSPEHGRLITKLGSVSRLDDADRSAVAALPMRTRSIEAGADLIPEGSVPDECCFVIDALVCRYALTSEGNRQIVSVHIPGDLPDRDSLHLNRLDHGIATLAPSRLAFIAHSALRPVVEALPNVAIAFWRDAVVDGGIYRQWLTSVGRRNSRQRLAHLICETFTRMQAVGLSDGDHFNFPITQAQLGDALGLSTVHINRTLQELRQDELVAWKSSIVTILDWDGLRRAGDFDPAYLQLRSSID